MLYRVATLREATTDDRSCIVPLWLNSHCNSQYGQDRSRGIDSDGHRTRFIDRYWSVHEPRLHHWLDSANTVVICDTEAPEIVWAFAVFANPNTIHYSAVKLQFKEHAHECFKWMLGSRLHEYQRVTHELVDFRRHKFKVPRLWDVDPYWAAA